MAWQHHTDPVYGWANNNRERPAGSYWDGRPNSFANTEADDSETTFTSPSDSFTPPSDSFTLPSSDWSEE